MRRFPINDISNNSRRSHEVTRDGGKIKRRYSVDKTFKWPVLHPVPYPGGGNRLVSGNFIEGAVTGKQAGKKRKRATKGVKN
jgi:hypothetical protein